MSENQKIDPPSDPPVRPPEKDCDLLRRAGEHLGALGERAYEQLLWTFNDVRKRSTLHERYARLTRLSPELWEER